MPGQVDPVVSLLCVLAFKHLPMLDLEMAVRIARECEDDEWSRQHGLKAWATHHARILRKAEAPDAD